MWAGALEGRVISKYFTNWGGSDLFDTQPGKGKYYSMSVRKFPAAAGLSEVTKANF